MLLCVSWNKRYDHLNTSQNLRLRRKWETMREINCLSLFCFDSVLEPKETEDEAQIKFLQVHLDFLFSPLLPPKQRMEKSNAGNSVLQGKVNT